MQSASPHSSRGRSVRSPHGGMTSPKAMTNARPRKAGGMYLDDDIQVGKHGLTPETVYDVAVVASRDAESGEEGGTSAVRRKELAVKAGEAKQRKLNVVCLVLGMIGLVLSIVVAEMLFDNQDEATPVIDGLKACITVTTALLLVFLVIRTNSLLKLYKLRGGMDEDETLRTSGLITPLMLELVLCVVHAPPGVSFSISVTNMGGPVTYSVDAFVSLWQLMRLYLIVSVFNDMVGFRTAQARVIAKWNNVSFDAAFAFKALMERAPLSLLGFVMLSLIFVLGYCLRVLERPLCAPFLPPHSLCDQVFVRTDANSLANMFWFVIITMTTVGYGDMFPLTYGGRAVAVITCLVGVAVIALLVTVITSMSTFRPDEMRAFNALYRNTGRKLFQDSAARMVQACWVYSRGQRFALRLKEGDDPATAARSIQTAHPQRRRRGSIVNQAVRRLSQTVGPHSSRYSLSNGNLHMRHKSRFGKAHLLLALRQWKRDKAAYLSLTREKSEVAMVVKEILDVRGRLNEMNEEMERHSEQQERAAARMKRMEAMLESITMHLKVPLAPAKRLAPISNPPSTSPDDVGEVKATPGSQGGGGSSNRGGIQWQWHGTDSPGNAGSSRDSKLAPIASGVDAPSSMDADEDLLAEALPGGLTPAFGGLPGASGGGVVSLGSGRGSRRNLSSIANSGSGTVVPLGRIGALGEDRGSPASPDDGDMP